MTAELLKKAGELADGEQPDEAMAICSQILVNEPDHPGALFVAGCILLKAQRHAHAIQFGKRIVQVCPKDHRGWELLCLVWGELHRYDESVRMAMKALACKRTDKTLADAAYAHVNCGNWADGDKFSKAAILEAKTNPICAGGVSPAGCDGQSGVLQARCERLGAWVRGLPDHAAHEVAQGVDVRRLERVAWGSRTRSSWLPASRVSATRSWPLRWFRIRCTSRVKFILDCDHRLATAVCAVVPECTGNADP
jgi:hypothetical protein